MSTLALYNLVPHSLDDQSERLKRFRESQDAGAAGGEGGIGYYSDDDMDEDTMHSQEYPEESTHESDGEGEESNFGWDDPHDERESRVNTPQHTGSRACRHSSDKHLRPCWRNWGGVLIQGCEGEWKGIDSGGGYSGRKFLREHQVLRE